MELVWSDHAADCVPVLVTVVARDAGEEPGDLEDDLGAVPSEEVPVPGGLVVLPGVVCHRDTDVALQIAGVRKPPAGLRVEVNEGALLGAVTAGLPRKHGAGVTGRGRGSPGGGETMVAGPRSATG